MFRIEEGCKIKLKTGEIASVDEVLKEGEAYIVGVIKANRKISIEQISYSDIESVFEEIERPLREAM